MSVNVNRSVSDQFYRYKMPRLIAKVTARCDGFLSLFELQMFSKELLQKLREHQLHHVDSNQIQVAWDNIYENKGMTNFGCWWSVFCVLFLIQVEGKGNGIKTVIVNMVDVAKALNRPPTCKLHMPCAVTSSVCLTPTIWPVLHQGKKSIYTQK